MFQYNPTSLDHYIVENYICARSDMNSVDPAGKKLRGKFHHPLNKQPPSPKMYLGREYTNEYDYLIRNIP